MYKIQVSRFIPFWNNSDINYPDFEKFDNQDIFTNENISWTDIPNGSFNWLQSNTAWVQIDVQQYKIDYLRVIDTYTNKYYYFFVVDFFDMTTKTIKLNLELDNWMTYGKNILDNLKNENPNIFFNKKHMNRYSIMDNIPTTNNETIIDKVFTHTKRYNIRARDIDQSTHPYQSADGEISPHLLESFIGPHPANTNNSFFFYSPVSFVEEIATQYREIITRYGIVDTGTELYVTINSPNSSSKIISKFYHMQSTDGWQGIYGADHFLDVNFSYTTPIDTLYAPHLSNLGKIELRLNQKGVFHTNTHDYNSDLKWNISSFGATPQYINNYSTKVNIIYSDLEYCCNPVLLDGLIFDVTISVRLKGKIPAQQITPTKTTYNVNYLVEQQHLLNTDDLSNLGQTKLNISKTNHEITPLIFKDIKVLNSSGSAITYTWKTPDNNFFKLKNGFYLYGVLKFPINVDAIDDQLINFITSDPSNNIFVYIPVLQSQIEGDYFYTNTRAYIESMFGTNLLGIISSPIPPTSLSESVISIKRLFLSKPPFDNAKFDKMHAFVAPAFKTQDFITIPKTPYSTEIFTPFTPPTTNEEKWEKKLTTLNWQNETILFSPQYLEYYLTNGSNQINVNNYVNITYADQNYLIINWALTPISSLIYALGLFDLNRYESQKNVLAYSGILPCNSSTYNQWILENSASINMGLKSASATRDKEMTMGALDILSGGIQAVIGGKYAQTGFKWGNPEGVGKHYTGLRGRPKEFYIPAEPNAYGSAFYSGASSAARGAGGIVGGIDRMVTADLNYKNYQRQISGMNSDAQTKSTIITSDDATYINTFSAVAPLSMIYMGLKPNDCLTIWWNCLINGYNVNRNFYFNEYDNRTYYNYLSVSDISPWILTTKDTPQVYKEWFISKFSDGLRLWKTWLNFGLDNKEVFVDKIDNAIIPPITPARKKKNGKR